MIPQDNPSPTRCLSIREIVERTGCSRPSIYEMLSAKSPRYDPSFPTPFKIGKRTLFVEAEIEHWLQQKIADSRMLAI